MKRVLLSVLCLTLILCLCACGNSITDGEVYKKEYKEAYTTVKFLPLIIPNGKSITTTFVPYNVHYPERYVIYIKKHNGEEWLTEDFYVSADTYTQINVGDMFQYDKSRGDLKDEPYTKERKARLRENEFRI